MNDQIDPATRAHFINRRKAILGTALSVGGLVVASTGSGHSQNVARTTIHQEVKFNASPMRIYQALLDSKQFTAFSGAAAEIDPKAGGAFSLFEGQIVGRTVEVVPDERLVQAWRPADWKQGLYSIVRFELKPAATGTTLVLDHTGFPAAEYDSLNSGWYEHYWEPLKRYLA